MNTIAYFGDLRQNKGRGKLMEGVWGVRSLTALEL